MLVWLLWNLGRCSMKKYNVVVKTCQEYELEIEAEDEDNAYDLALDEYIGQYPSDDYLLDIQIEEVEE